MDSDKLKIIQIFFFMGMQFLLVVVATGIWIFVTIELIANQSWPMAATEGLLTLTLAKVYSYFFKKSKE
jgi:hypothetical protein